ncbi:MAG: hypothetical protein A2Y80_06835 [Deltaproteobacteria bacterium RBG_13_58_19]|nr:MAG: hypothetical protein A2Y80_06835 [Deltaproteobacteria bacterium RBG_13_58_19]
MIEIAVLAELDKYERLEVWGPGDVAVVPHLTRRQGCSVTVPPRPKSKRKRIQNKWRKLWLKWLGTQRIYCIHMSRAELEEMSRTADKKARVTE